jgi:hypothetical protein
VNGLLAATRVAELRSALTGEPATQLVPTTQGTLANLNQSQQVQLAGIVSEGISGFSGRLLGVASPTVDHMIRSAVLPDATTAAQRELETAVLLAIGRAHNYRRPDANGLGAKPYKWVRPRDSELVLMLTPQALAAVLAELVPREHGGRLVGLAGLRIRQNHGHAELFLADTNPQAMVRVPRISRRQLAAALAFNGVTAGSPAWPGGLLPALSDIEALFAAAGRVASGPTALGSAMLRRLGALGDVEQIVIDAVGSCLRLDWTGDASAARVATLLTHPVAGLPDEMFTTTMPADGTIILSCGGLRGSIALRRSDPAAPKLGDRLTIMDAWRSFDDVMVAPPDLTVVPPREANHSAARRAIDG